MSGRNGANGGRQLVLVVDDYPDARDMYRAYLELRGYDVVEAANGLEALQRAVDELPAVILMDLSLPIMDGWEATRRLKQDPRTAKIPIVALTGIGSNGTSRASTAGQWDAFVAKPCLPEEIEREIRVVLHAPEGRFDKGSWYEK